MESEKSKTKKKAKLNIKEFSQLKTIYNLQNKPQLTQKAFLRQKSQDPIIHSSRNKQTEIFQQNNERQRKLSINQGEQKKKKVKTFKIININSDKKKENKKGKEELEAIDPIEIANQSHQDNDLVLEQFKISTQQMLANESEFVKQTIQKLTSSQENNSKSQQKHISINSISKNNFKEEIHSKLKKLQVQSRDASLQMQIAECKKWSTESKATKNQIVNKIFQNENESQIEQDQELIGLRLQDLGEKQIDLKKQEADLQNERTELTAKMKDFIKEKLVSVTKQNLNLQQEQINKMQQERQLQLDQKRSQFENEKKEMEYLINQSFEECLRKDEIIQSLKEEVKNEKVISANMNQKIIQMQEEMSDVQKKAKQRDDSNQLRIKELEEELQALRRKLNLENKDKLQKTLQIPVEAQHLELPTDFKEIIPPIKPPNFEKQPQEIQQCYHNAVICNALIKPPPNEEEIQKTKTVLQKGGIHNIMSCILNQVGAQYLISSNEEKSNIKTLHMLASDQCNMACFSATFLNHNIVNSAIEFQQEIKDSLSKCLKKSIHEISIVNQFTCNNEIVVNLVIDKVFKQDDNVPEIAYEAQEGLKQRFQENISIMPIKLFEFFYLSEDVFDSDGDIKFGSKNGLVLQRGGYDYNQPCNLFYRVGLKVSGKFDNGCNLWLQTADGNGKEWAVGFHGLRHDVRSSVKGIIQKGFEVKWDQGFRGDIDIGRNQQNFVDQERCGNGIYLAPHVDICMGKNFEKLSYCRPVKFNDTYYIVIFQCRIKPSMIRIPQCSKGEYYIINDPTNIRPYGIVLRKYTKDEVLEYINNLPREDQKQYFIRKMKEEE